MRRFMKWLPVFLAYSFLVFTDAAVDAAEFPTQSVQFIVGAAAGGSTDIVARLIAPKLSEKWGQPVLVLNRPGADGRLAADFVARSKADGYTIFVTVNDIVLPTPKGMTTRFDSVKSFSPIALLATGPGCLGVSASVPVNSVKELVALMKLKEGKFNFSTNGHGGPYETGWRHLMKLTGAASEVLHYDGGGPALIAVVGQEAQATTLPCFSLLPHLQSGKVKILAITEKTDFPLLSKVPTFEEATGLPEYDGGGSTWYGLLAPAGTPDEIINKVHLDVEKVLGDPSVRTPLLNRITTPAHHMTSQDFGHLIKTDVARWEAWISESESSAR